MDESFSADIVANFLNSSYKIEDFFNFDARSRRMFSVLTIRTQMTFLRLVATTQMIF